MVRRCSIPPTRCKPMIVKAIAPPVEQGDPAPDAEEEEVEEEANGEAEENRTEEPEPEARPRPTTQQALALPGPDSPAEVERKLARLEELEQRVPMLERQKLALEAEIEDLKAAKPVTLTEALQTALDLARKEARHDAGLSSGKAKRREQALTAIRGELNVLLELQKQAKTIELSANDDGIADSLRRVPKPVASTADIRA